MKKSKINSNLPVLLILSLLGILNLVSCVNQGVEPIKEVDLFEYGINTEENRQAILSLMDDRVLLQESFQETNTLYRDNFISNDKSTLAEEDEITFEELLVQYESCSDCSENTQDILVPLLTDMAVTTDDELISTINKYESIIEGNSNLSDDAKSQLYFLTFVFKATAETHLEEQKVQNNKSGWRDCFRKKAGKNVGEGIGTGFLLGCVTGGIIGGLGGTVLLPGVGTFGGVAAGCVMTGAMGAVAGGLFGLIKTGVSCLFN